MSRLINILLFLVLLVGAFWLYQVKHEAKETERQIADLQRQIQEEKEALLLLKAEWSYLNRPDRVQELTERFAKQLGLSEVAPHQLGEANDLPERNEDGPGGDRAVQSIDDLLGKASVRSAPLPQQ